MAYRGIKSIPTSFQTPRRNSKRFRIEIPQSPERPVKDVGKDLLKRELFDEDPWWLTVHRRGISRPYVGGNPLEARAVPYDEVRGFLHERIVYKFLRDKLHLIPDADFLFQSAQDGGRLEMGGIVSDFFLPDMRLILSVTGAGHEAFLRGRKDEEQKDSMAELGYVWYDLPVDVIANEYRFEELMRRIFNLYGGGGSSFGMVMEDEVVNNDSSLFILAQQILDEAEQIYEQVSSIII